MKEAGIAIGSIGALLALFALFIYQPTYSSEFDPDAVVNLQLLARQVGMVIVGGFAFLSGVVLYCCSILTAPRNPAASTKPVEGSAVDTGAF